MRAMLLDKDGEVNLDDLTCEGRHEAAFQCYRLLEDIVDADDPGPESEEVSSCLHGLDFATIGL